MLTPVVDDNGPLRLARLEAWLESRIESPVKAWIELTAAELALRTETGREAAIVNDHGLLLRRSEQTEQ